MWSGRAQRHSEPGNRNPEPGTRNPELGTRSPELGTRNPELAARNAEPATSQTLISTVDSWSTGKLTELAMKQSSCAR